MRFGLGEADQEFISIHVGLELSAKSSSDVSRRLNVQVYIGAK